MVLKNIKSFTAMKIIDAIINNLKENRKQWMLGLFEQNGKLSMTRNSGMRDGPGEFEGDFYG